MTSTSFFGTVLGPSSDGLVDNEQAVGIDPATRFRVEFGHLPFGIEGVVV
jgi:hypothetical protein